ncbi:eCIS core domain-containing protein, partial [Streptomyces sp. SPB78]
MHGQDRRSGGEARGGRTPRAETTAPGRPAPVGSPRAVLALQRAAGNAAVAEALERGRHEHGEGCGHGTPVQRSAVERVIGSAGTPLPSPVRQDMESRLGADFADVRLHTDEAA